MVSELVGRLRELGGLVYESGIFSDTAICFDAASALAASEAQVSTLSRQLEEARADKARLDWLETHAVNVRVPLVHGSRDLFWATPDDSFEGEPGPSDLRKQIDARRAKETVSHA